MTVSYDFMSAVVTYPTTRFHALWTGDLTHMRWSCRSGFYPSVVLVREEGTNRQIIAMVTFVECLTTDPAAAGPTSSPSTPSEDEVVDYVFSLFVLSRAESNGQVHIGDPREGYGRDV